MYKKESFNYLSSAFTLFLTAIQDNAIYQITTFIMGIISFIVSIAYTIFKWYLKAKKDGQITLDEVEELKNEIKKENK